jgi:hypothetical protein
MMPNKTIYVKDTDLPLFARAQEQLGESLSSLFADFLRERVASLTPAEGRMKALVGEIARRREALKKDRGVPAFIDVQYAEAAAHARQSLQRLQAGQVSEAKTSYFAANAYLEWADRDLRQARELLRQLAEMRGGKGRAKPGLKK